MDWKTKIDWEVVRFFILYIIIGTLLFNIAQAEGKSTSTSIRVAVFGGLIFGWLINAFISWLLEIRENAIARLKQALRLTRVNALRFTGFLMIAPLLFPPYVRITNIRPGWPDIVRRERGFLFDSPPGMQIDITTLFVELLLVAVIGGLLYLFGKKE